MPLFRYLAGLWKANHSEVVPSQVRGEEEHFSGWDGVICCVEVHMGRLSCLYFTLGNNLTGWLKQVCPRTNCRSAGYIKICTLPIACVESWFTFRSTQPDHTTFSFAGPLFLQKRIEKVSVSVSIVSITLLFVSLFGENICIPYSMPALAYSVNIFPL